jgi:predicted GNAT superfamily acetyltransferase
MRGCCPSWDETRAFCFSQLLSIVAAMNSTALLPISAADVAPPSPLAGALLALNNDHAQELSWLTPERLTHVVGEAFYLRRVGHVDAFLLAFDQDADYDSPNFLWFRARYPRFVYVDRIVVASSARGRGLARRLYEALFEEAERAGHSGVVCEVNSDPPNPGSDALHAALGFAEVGSAAIHDGSKTVRYLMRNLEDHAAVAGGRASTE